MCSKILLNLETLLNLSGNILRSTLTTKVRNTKQNFICEKGPKINALKLSFSQKLRLLWEMIKTSKEVNNLIIGIQ